MPEALGRFKVIFYLCAGCEARCTFVSTNSSFQTTLHSKVTLPRNVEKKLATRFL